VSAAPGQQVQHLPIGGLAEVAVTLMNSPKRFRMARAHHFVDHLAEHRAGVPGADRDRDDQP